MDEEKGKLLFISGLVILFCVAGIGGYAYLTYSSNDRPAVSAPPQECLSSEIKNEAETIRCLEEYFQNITKNESADAALIAAENLVREGIISDCHLPAHIIGEYNLALNDFNFSKALTTCSDRCIQGCYHGVVAEQLNQMEDPSQIMALVDTLCASVESQELVYRQCVHGFGHGLVSSGLFVLEEIVNVCESFDDEFSQTTCKGGVFMETTFLYIGLEEEEFRETLPAICEETRELKDDDLFEECLIGLGGGVMFYTGHDVDRSNTFCDELDDDSVETCKDGVREEKDIRDRFVREKL